MNNTSNANLEIIAQRLKSYRIEYPMTQKELADKSGVSLRSIQNLENGSDIQAGNLFKVLNALDLGENILLLVPDMSCRPSAYLTENKTRKRARKKVIPSASFRWGDEK